MAWRVYAYRPRSGGMREVVSSYETLGENYRVRYANKHDAECAAADLACSWDDCWGQAPIYGVEEASDNCGHCDNETTGHGTCPTCKDMLCRSCAGGWC